MPSRRKNETLEIYHKRVAKYHREKAQFRVKEGRKKLGGKCVNCGCIDNLHFDHIDPKTKNGTIAEIAGFWGEKRFWQEIDKCQLLCKPCHISKSREDGSLNTPQHGDRSMYASHGCRCNLCTEAQRNYMKNYLWKRGRMERHCSAKARSDLTV